MRVAFTSPSRNVKSHTESLACSKVAQAWYQSTPIQRSPNVTKSTSISRSRMCAMSIAMNSKPRSRSCKRGKTSSHREVAFHTAKSQSSTRSRLRTAKSHRRSEVRWPCMAKSQSTAKSPFIFDCEVPVVKSLSIQESPPLQRGPCRLRAASDTARSLSIESRLSYREVPVVKSL